MVGENSNINEPISKPRFIISTFYNILILIHWILEWWLVTFEIFKHLQHKGLIVRHYYSHEGNTCCHLQSIFPTVGYISSHLFWCSTYMVFNTTHTTLWTTYNLFLLSRFSTKPYSCWKKIAFESSSIQEGGIHIKL